jgi:hypothetical protein
MGALNPGSAGRVPARPRSYPVLLKISRSIAAKSAQYFHPSIAAKSARAAQSGLACMVSALLCTEAGCMAARSRCRCASPVRETADLLLDDVGGPKAPPAQWSATARRTVVLCPDGSHFPAGRQHPPGSRGRIELLNTRWHHPVHSYWPGSCPVCGADIRADDRTEYMDGALHHLRCCRVGA